MTIREIVSKLEEIEHKLSKKNTDSECEMVAELIDTIIADDLDLNSKNITGTGGIPAANLTGNVAAARIASTAVPAANLTGNVASARLSSSVS